MSAHDRGTQVCVSVNDKMMMIKAKLHLCVVLQRSTFRILPPRTYLYLAHSLHSKMFVGGLNWETSEGEHTVYSAYTHLFASALSLTYATPTLSSSPSSLDASQRSSHVTLASTARWYTAPS